MAEGETCLDDSARGSHLRGVLPFDRTVRRPSAHGVSGHVHHRVAGDADSGASRAPAHFSLSPLRNLVPPTIELAGATAENSVFSHRAFARAVEQNCRRGG